MPPLPRSRSRRATAQARDASSPSSIPVNAATTSPPIEARSYPPSCTTTVGSPCAPRLARPRDSRPPSPAAGSRGRRRPHRRRVRRRAPRRRGSARPGRSRRQPAASRVAGPRRERHVEVRPLPRSRTALCSGAEEVRKPARGGVDVHGAGEHIAAIPEDLLSAVAVVRIDVENRRPARRRARAAGAPRARRC